MAALYGLAVLCRRLAYDRGWLQQHAPTVPTVSVGGLEAGGSGKTPVVGLLLAALARAGKRPGLLTRGYGRTSQGMQLRAPGEPPDPAVLGDEPAMLVAAGNDVAVAACARRADGAARLVELGCDTLVLDDGFAHRSLARDLDIVVLRGEQPFGNGHLLPWGTLREPPSSLRRAQVIWLHFRGEPRLDSPAWVARLCPEALVVISRGQPHGPFSAAGESIAPAGDRLVAAAGIAAPADLAQSLADLGCEVVHLARFADHHTYSIADVERLAALAETHNAAAVAVTEKDAIKLAPIWQGPPLWVLGTRVIVCQGGEDLAGRLGIPVGALDA